MKQRKIKINLSVQDAETIHTILSKQWTKQIQKALNERNESEWQNMERTHQLIVKIEQITGTK